MVFVYRLCLYIDRVYYRQAGGEPDSHWVGGLHGPVGFVYVVLAGHFGGVFLGKNRMTGKTRPPGWGPGLSPQVGECPARAGHFYLIFSALDKYYYPKLKTRPAKPARMSPRAPGYTRAKPQGHQNKCK